MVQSVLRPRQVVTKHSSAKLTYDDYVRFPDDGLRHEIIEGEHYVSPSPQTAHQRILARLSYLIQRHLEAHPVAEMLFAPFDVLLSEFNVLVPDLIVLSTERSRLLTSKNLQGAPDLVVEILSPSTASRDRTLKRDVYERHGVDEYWVVSPQQRVVQVHRRRGEKLAPPIQFGANDILTTPILPGLELPLAKIFA
jgi:Uma2 family endonuclease